MEIEKRTPQSSVKENTPVVDFVNQVLEKENPKPIVTEEVTKTISKKEMDKIFDSNKPQPKANHGVIQTAPPKPKPLTEHEIYALKKDEQIEILNKLGVTEIPHYEKERVALIVKLQ